MSVRRSLGRRIADVLMRHAAGVLPSTRAMWAAAMKHELDHIGSDLDAIVWAVGCVLAGYVERSRVNDLLQIRYARAVVAFLIGTQVVSMLFATVLTVAYRLHYVQIAGFLGGVTPGGDYHRFIPLMKEMPWWVHGLWLLSSLLFGVSAWRLVENRRSAFLLFASAWLLGMLGDFVSQTMPAYREAFSFRTPVVMRDDVIPAASLLLPILIALALWAHGRCFLPERTGRS